MGLYDYFHMFFFFATEMLLSIFLLTPKKKNLRQGALWRIPLGLAISYGSTVAAYFLVVGVGWNVWMNIFVYTLIFAAIIGAVALVYPLPIKELFLQCMVAYTMQHIAYQIGVIVFDTGLHDLMLANMGYDAATWTYEGLLALLKVLLYLGLYFSLVRLYIQNFHYLLNRGFVIAMSIYVYVVAVVANAIAHNYVPVDSYLVMGVFAGLLGSCCILFDVLVVGGFKFVERKQNALLMASTYEAKIRQAEMTEKNIDFINMKCHDLRKFIRELRQNQHSISEEEFQVIEDSLRLYDTGVRTGSPNLDVLLQDKALYCKAHGIEFTPYVDALAFSSCDPSDIHFLFMNVIDNAIEASENIVDKQRRIISLTAYKRHGALIVEEMNYYDGEIRRDAKGRLLSAKEDPILHGYGVKSIEYIVGKYNGQLTIDSSDNIFRLRIVI